MWFNSNRIVLHKHTFVLFGILPGILFFTIMLITYIIAKNNEYHYLVLNSEFYTALILFPIMSYLFKKKNSITTKSVFFNYLLLNNFVIGLVWGLITCSLYNFY
jgi:hypothetical protein